MSKLKSNPKVSVIMPVYNAKHYLIETLKSIILQSYTDFEFIIIDDGSSDDSLLILQEFQKNEPRLKVISRENKGVGCTLNELLLLAKGEYIARMDADDICHPERLSLQVAFLDSHPDHVMVGGQVDAIDPSGRRLMSLVKAFEHEEIEDALLRSDAFSIIHPAVMLRTQALRNIGGYDESLEIAEDTDMFLRLARIGKIANLQEKVIDYRMHQGSATHSKRHKARRLTAMIIERELIARGNTGDSSTVTMLKDDNFMPNETESDLLEKWAWWAFHGKEFNTFLYYSFKSWRLAPLELRKVKMLLYALRRQCV